MPDTKPIPVDQLKLDLNNFRTVQQTNELYAVQSLISIHPEYFWALMESLIDDGYLPTENILVLRGKADESELLVKEGNRRVAALKLIHGYIPSSTISIPDTIKNKINKLSIMWKTANGQVPCTIYTNQEESIVDKIVTLTHGIGEKAGRDRWNAVARARHSRDVNKSSQPALDLLENYLKIGNNLLSQQAERWAGDFPLTVLEEAMKRLAPRFGVSNAPDLAKQYPSIQSRDTLDDILRDIGLEIIGFKEIRSTTKDFATHYGVPPAQSSEKASDAKSQEGTARSSNGETNEARNQSQDSKSSHSHATSNATESGDTEDTAQSNATKGAEKSGQPDGSSAKKTAAVAVQDPRAVKRILKVFRPRGDNREKVVTLRNEALKLKIEETPLAFCFLLRSMFEISAKAYCDDHKANGGPSLKKHNGQEKPLVEILRDITGHLTDRNNDKAMVKVLHGSMTELGKPEGILSVTSMNQLVHNPKFLLTASDISTVFGNIFPLLEAMN